MGRLALVAALFASSCSSPGAVSPAGGDDAGSTESSQPCGLFGCFDADVVEASLAVRAQSKLTGCRGMEYCHGNGAGGMTLTSGGEFDATIGVRSVERPDLLRVQPGDPLQSYLFLKVWCDGGIEGGCMSGDPTVVQMFHDWIEAGAPTN